MSVQDQANSRQGLKHTLVLLMQPSQHLADWLGEFVCAKERELLVELTVLYETGLINIERVVEKAFISQGAGLLFARLKSDQLCEHSHCIFVPALVLPLLMFMPLLMSNSQCRLCTKPIGV